MVIGQNPDRYAAPTETAHEAEALVIAAHHERAWVHRCARTQGGHGLVGGALELDRALGLGARGRRLGRSARHHPRGEGGPRHETEQWAERVHRGRADEVQPGDRRLESPIEDGLPVDAAHAREEIRGEEAVLTDVDAVAGRHEDVIDRTRAAVVEPEAYPATAPCRVNDGPSGGDDEVAQARPQPERRAGRERAPRDVVLHRPREHPHKRRVCYEVADLGGAHVRAIEEQRADDAVARRAAYPAQTGSAHDHLYLGTALLE